MITANAIHTANANTSAITIGDEIDYRHAGQNYTAIVLNMGRHEGETTFTVLRDGAETEIRARLVAVPAIAKGDRIDYVAAGVWYKAAEVLHVEDREGEAVYSVMRKGHEVRIRARLVASRA